MMQECYFFCFMHGTAVSLFLQKKKTTIKCCRAHLVITGLIALTEGNCSALHIKGLQASLMHLMQEG